MEGYFQDKKSEITNLEMSVFLKIDHVEEDVVFPGIRVKSYIVITVVIFCVYVAHFPGEKFI